MSSPCAVAAPAEVIEGLRSIKAAFLYVANWFFIRESNDYFGGDINSSPVVHFWSLSIEEQFYAVLPLVVLAAHRIGGRRTQAWALLLILLLIGVVARAVLWAQYGREELGQVSGYYPSVYYATLCRFDEFLPGIGVALLKNFHPALWQEIQRRGRPVLLAGLAATGLMLYGAFRFYYIDGYGYGFFMSVFGY